MSSVQKFDFDVKQEEKDMKEFILRIRPSWKIDDIHVQEVSGGILNYIWKCTNIHDTEDIVAVKLYGEVSKILLDKKKENEVIEILNEAGIIPTVYAIARNGFAYKFSTSSNLLPEQLFDRKVNKLVINKMHQIHSIVPNDKTDSFESFTPGYMKKWNDEVSLSMPHTQQYKMYFPPVDELNVWVSAMYDIYKDLKDEFPYCFCHNDMHRLNLLYDPVKGEIGVLDLDFNGFSPEPMELGCHFVRDVDNAAWDSGHLLLEDEEHIKWFVRTYLETHPKLSTAQIDDQMVTKWTTGSYKAMFVISCISVIISICEAARNPSTLGFLRCGVNQYERSKQIKDMLEIMEKK